MNEFTSFLPDENTTLELGRALAAGLAPGMTMYLIGDLGAGKTTLARGLLRGLGYAGKVKSPTFTLVEVYEFSRLYLYHFDFYRFGDPQELEQMGFRDYFNPESVCIVEWPNKAAGLPPADLKVVLEVASSGRNVAIVADSEAGASCLRRLQT